MATFPRCTTHFPRFKTATLLLWALLPVAFSGTLHAEDQYRAVFADDLARVVVEACFDGAAPAYLYRHRRAGAFAGKVLINGSPVPATAEGSRIELPSLPADSCVEWQVDLAQAVAAGDERLAMRLDLPMHESTAARQAASPGEVPDSLGGSPPEEHERTICDILPRSLSVTRLRELGESWMDSRFRGNDEHD